MPIFLLGSEPIYEPAGPNGVLLLHSFAGSPGELREIADVFINNNISVSAPLLKGHGTKTEDLKDCRWYEWFSDAKNALFELRKNCKKIVVIGQCMGSCLGLHLAAHYQVEGFAGISTGLRLRHSHNLRPSFFPNRIVSYQKYFSAKQTQNNEKATTPLYSKIPTNAFRELYKLFSHTYDDLKDVYIPVLLVHKGTNNFIDIQNPEIICSRLSSKDKRLLTHDQHKNITTLEITRFGERLFKQKFKTHRASEP